jgi:pilus assembly protein Flp/PilA
MLKAYLLAQTKLAAAKARFVSDESGAALIEYSLLIGLIVVGAVVAMAAVGVKIGGDWGDFKTKIGA